MEISQYCILQRHLPNNMIFDHPLIWVGGADAILIRLCWVWGTLGLGYEWLPWSAAEYEQPENVLLQRTHSSFLFPDINIECNILENEILGSQHTHTNTWLFWLEEHHQKELVCKNTPLKSTRNHSETEYRAEKHLQFEISEMTLRQYTTSTTRIVWK